MTSTTWAIVATVAWAAVLGITGFVVVRRRREAAFGAEHGLFLGGLACLAAAPAVAVITLAVDGTPSLFGAGMHLGFAVLLMAAAARARYGRRHPDRVTARLTWPEKSAALVLAGLALVFAAYFANTWGATLEEAIPAFAGAVVLLVILMIVGHTALALFHFPIGELNEPADERDRAVQMRSMRNAYFALGAGIWTIPIVTLAPLPTIVVLNTWLATIVVSELVYYGSQVAYYRLGTD